MRILGKALRYIAAGLLFLQGALVLMGYPFHGLWAGLELIAMAIYWLADASYCFKNPVEPYTELEVTYRDGSKRIVMSRPGRSDVITSSKDNPVTDISVTYYVDER